MPQHPKRSSMAAQDQDYNPEVIQLLLDKLTLAESQPTFTLFPMLPPELRLKILREALPFGNKEGRFIQAKARITARPRRSRGAPCWFIVEDNVDSSKVKDMALLRMNKESRNEYLLHFDKSLRAKGEGLIRYRSADTIYITNIGRLMRNASMRAVITEGSRLEHLLNSCTNIAAPSSYFMESCLEYKKWFGDQALYPFAAPLFGQLKTVSVVLRKAEAGQFAHLLRVTQDRVRQIFWCYIRREKHRIREAKEAENLGSGQTYPKVLLTNEDGDVLGGRVCKQCYKQHED